VSARIVAIDAGATWSRGMLLIVEGSKVELAAAARGGAGNPNHVGDAVALANVSSLLLGLLAAAGVPGTALDGVAVSSSVASTGAGAARLCPSARVVCVPDPVAALFSASSGDSGVVVTAGTGSMVSRVVDGRAEHTAGGWGWALGDEGGAVSLGRQCLRAVLRSWESGPPTMMAAMVGEYAGLHSEDEVYQRVYRSGLVPLSLATLAPVVTTAAAAGDPVASRILDGDADHLAEQARSLLVPSGSLVVSGGLAGDLSSRIADRLGLAPVVVRDGVVGAALLVGGELGVDLERDLLAELWGPHQELVVGL
jgi:glucosamine kinase